MCGNDLRSDRLRRADRVRQQEQQPAGDSGDPPATAREDQEETDRRSGNRHDPPELARANVGFGDPRRHRRQAQRRSHREADETGKAPEQTPANVQLDAA